MVVWWTLVGIVELLAGTVVGVGESKMQHTFLSDVVECLLNTHSRLGNFS